MLYDKAPKIVFAVEHVQFRGRRVLWAIPTPRASVVLDLFICWPVQSNLETKRSKKSREGLKKDPEQLEANHKKYRERRRSGIMKEWAPAQLQMLKKTSLANSNLSEGISTTSGGSLKNLGT